MKRFMVAAGLALISASADAQVMTWPAPERTEFRQPQSAVPITRVGGYPVVEVVANGRTFRFGLETGGSLFAVSPRLAETLGLAVTPSQNPNAGGPRGTVTIDSVQLGGVVFHNVQAAVSETFAARGWDGIVSPPLLRDVMYTLDLRGNRLGLERGALPEVDDRTVLPISRKDRGRRIDFPLDLGGVLVHPVIDTQSLMDITISDSLEQSLRLNAPPVVIGQARGPSQGTFNLRGTRLSAQARIGATSLPSLPIIFRDRPGPVAGVAFLEQFVITVDDRNGRVRFVPHDATVRFATASWEQPGAGPTTPGPAAASGSTGRYLLGLRASGTPPTVISVEPGSNIERAGIRVGDLLVEVAGTPIERMTPDVWQRVLADGKPVRLTLSRDAQRYQTDVTPIARPESSPAAGPAPAVRPAPQPPRATDLREEIERLNQSMMAAWQRNDWRAVAAHYSDDARIIGPGGQAVEGRTNVDAYWQRFPMQGRDWRLEVFDTGGAHDLAYQYGRSTISGGSRSQAVNFIGVWKRQADGSLKLAIDYWTPSAPSSGR